MKSVSILVFAYVLISITACQCFGHSNECIYDEEVDNLGLSIDVNGNYEGGGVCQNCQDNTMGTNCDQCKPGYFRTPDKSLFDKDVCQGRFTLN